MIEILKALREWFAPEDHVDRDLPGGGKWFYVPWQRIRERLDDVCPDWEVSYGEPSYVGDYCQVSCTISILGKSRQAIGNAPITLLSSSGKDMSRGTPIERAIADAFKNAAEAWGVCQYLDEQADKKTKAAFIRYMNGSGDGRAAARYHENEGNVQRGRSRSTTRKPSGQSEPPKHSTPAKKATAVTTAVTLPLDRKAMLELQKRVEGLCALLKCQVGDLDKISQDRIKKSVLTLDDSDLRRLRALAFIDWAAIARSDQGLPEIDLRREWTQMCDELDPASMGDTELFQAWGDRALGVLV